MTDEWPFGDDANRDDPLAKLRIPVVRSPYPRWKYEVCVVIAGAGDDDPLWGPALRPDDAEVKQILAYLDYRMDWYNPGWQAKMRRRPLDVDSGTNTVILQKFGDSDWRYRRMTFEHGMWPFRNMTERFTLERLLDHINDYGGEKNKSWWAHKAKYPEAFAATEAGEGAA